MKHCFWCRVMLLPEEITRDHIIPKYRGGSWVEPCCQTCQQQRSLISWVVGAATKAKGHKQRKIKRGINKKKFKARLVPLIEKFEFLINRRLSGFEKTECLKEIETAKLLVNYE